MKRIVLISCARKKLSDSAKSKDLYISTLFKLNLKYANRLNADGIYILSARYGLLGLEQHIDPYEKTLNTMSASEVKQWSLQVFEQIKKVSAIEDTEFVFLAGDKYRKYLLPHMNNFQIPLKGLPIGKQLKKLKELTS